MAGDFPNPEQLTEEQLRAAYEQEIKRVRVEHVLLENVVTMVNLGMRRTGLMPGTEDERDLGQVQLAIESVRALMPQVEQIAPEQAAPIRDAVSQLQMAFVQSSGGAPGAAPAGGTDGGGTDGGGSDGPGGGSEGPGGGSEGPGGGSDGPGGGEGPEGGPEPEPGPGPAQQSGRLWVPGQ